MSQSSRLPHPRVLRRGAFMLIAVCAVAAASILSGPAAFASGSGDWAYAYYAGANQKYQGVGVQGYLSEPNPYITVTPFAHYDSLAKISAASPDNTKAVEIGWIKSDYVNTDGGAAPHLFVRKVDGGHGCFNTSSCGFVPYSTTHTVGMAVPITTTPQQYIIEYWYGNW